MEEINLDQKRPEILRAVEFAKSRGATAIKVELEALLRRFQASRDNACQFCDEGSVRCDEDCNDGYIRCERRCDQGYIYGATSAAGDPCPEPDCDGGYVNCPNACDEGWVTCEECDGDWNTGRNWNDDACLGFILERLGIIESADNHYESIYRYDAERSPWLEFAYFYNDHSVDSELTFTVRLDNPENIFKVLDVIQAFKDLAEAVGNGIDVQGAGMHTAWLFSSDYSYPISREFYLDHPTVTRRKLSNFRRAMGMMMPALFFLAAPANGENWTRPFNYRMPQVGFYPEKYSAIYVMGGAMEFRVFDTCYDHPEQLFDNIVVMSNCLKYLSHNYNGPELTGSYRFGHDNSRTLDRLYMEENTLDLLYQHVDKLKPAYYTMAQLRKQRGMTVTKTTLKTHQQTVADQAKAAWREFNDRWNITYGIRIEELKYTMMRQYVESHSLSELQGKTESDILKLIDDQVKQRTALIDGEKPAEESFVRDFITREIDNIRPRFRVSLGE